MSRNLIQLLACALFVSPLLAQTQAGLHSKFFWDAAAGERGTLIRYGNWYGPGWWGGSEKADNPGPLPPIDALDAAAQKHDFGYQIAEELGKARPDLEAHYKALADAIAVRDAMKLSEDPTLWNPPAPDPALARRYRERIAVGFSNYQQKLNELKAWLPYRNPDVGDPEVLEKIWNPSPVLDDKQLEALMIARVRAWNRDYEKRQADKLRELRTFPPAAPGPKSISKAPLAASPAVSAVVGIAGVGRWVLVDVGCKEENGSAGWGTAQFSKSGMTVTVDFNHKGLDYRFTAAAKWSSPPSTLIPGQEVTLTAEAKGCDLQWPGGQFVTKAYEKTQTGSHTFTVPPGGTTTADGIPQSFQLTFEPYFHVPVGSVWEACWFRYRWVPAGTKPPDPISTAPASSVKPQVGADRLGHEWSMAEAVTYVGRWVRRGDSDVWDATWNNGAVAVLSISIAGTKVRISRKDAGFSTGLTAIYEGTLAADGTLEGTETATWPGHFTNLIQSWHGRIVK